MKNKFLLLVILFFVISCASKNAIEYIGCNPAKYSKKILMEARGPLPICSIEPRYPLKAQTTGTEGAVVVKFDIDATGKTENLKVVKSVPIGIFDHVAIQAVRFWRYNPEDAQVGVQTRLSFELEQGHM